MLIAGGLTRPYQDPHPHCFYKEPRNCYHEPRLNILPDIYNKNVDTMYNVHLLPDAACMDIGLAKDTTEKVAKDNKVKSNNNNGRMNANQHTIHTGQ